MSFAVLAELPLGTYRARGAQGEADRFPSPARLHAALVNAAGQGTRAIEDGPLLRLCDQDEAALAWLEQHPPSGMALPLSIANDEPDIAYRREGLLVEEGKVRKDKVAGKRRSGAVAVLGPFAWTWSEAPPPPVRTALEALCPDVSHLGTAESPVRLTVGEAEPTHLRDCNADLFEGYGLDLDVAMGGRTAALVDAYRETQLTVPTLSQDKHRWSETVLLPPTVSACREPARYRPVEKPSAEGPWSTVVLLPLERTIPPQERVAWAVAVHRALIAQIGDGAPSVLTGTYAPGAPQPANRVAVQWLPVGLLFEGSTGSAATLAVMLPAGAARTDSAAVTVAVTSLREVRRGRLGVLRLKARPTVLPAADFWSAPAPGTHRRWVTEPAAVPDTRPLRGAWSLGDAVALSAGLVHRDQLGGPGRGQRWYRDLVAAAVASGFEVLELERVMDGDLSRYVHRTQPGTIVQPYRALLSLGTLSGDRTLLAVGQSRHLGGGLLIPVDVPMDVKGRAPRETGQVGR